MTQTRSFLILALLFVAYLLFNQWQNDYMTPQAPAGAPATAASSETPAAAIPADTDDGAVPEAATASAPAHPDTGAAATAPVPAAGAKAPGQDIVVSTDLLRLTIDTRGGTIKRAELLAYPETLKSDDSVRLLDDRSTHLFLAQSGLTSSTSAAPNHNTLFQAAKTHYTLEQGQKSLVVDLSWTDPSGIKVIKRYTLHRGSYLVDLDQRVVNGSGATWSGNAYRQLQRVVPPTKEHSNFLAKMSDQSRYSFFGAAWYGPDKKFEKLAFDKFGDEPLNRHVTGGWTAMVQHYFFSAWIPPAKEADTFASAVVDQGKGAPHYVIRSIGPQIHVAPGQQADSQARLYVGPKLRDSLDSVAPGFELAVDYGMFTVVASPIHWVLSQLHGLTGNWGVAIILLVLLINVLLYKLSAAQYKSAAKMRKLKPRMDALKERYGDDKQKLQQATMELYKKEKINPVAGCLPLVIQIPVFFALYVVLRESVELRQAPFIGWIHDLSAADPYFILPVLNMAVMFVSQLLMPTSPGMDATQQKMMRFIPFVSMVFFAFFPAGLVLYYVVNGLCRLAQQWWVTSRIEAADTKVKAKA